MRRLIFSIVLICSISLLFLDILINKNTISSNPASITSPGSLDASGFSSPYSTDFYLAGEWEYYPGTLLFYTDDVYSVPGELGSFDPALFNELRTLRGEDLSSFHSEYIRAENIYAPEYINIPYSGISAAYDHIPAQVSSYRLMVENLPPVKGVDMILSLAGLVQGNYEVFINGRRGSAMLPPYGYPSYYLSIPDDGRAEIVIQTYNTSSLLNITPRLSFKGYAMVDFDTYRNVIISLSSVMLTSFIIMMVLMFSLDRKYLYMPFFIGIIFTANYVMNNIWATGYQGSVTSLIPQYILPHLALIFLGASVFLICIYCREIFSDSSKSFKRSKKVLDILLVLSAAGEVLRIVNLFFTSTTFFIIIADILILFAVICLIVLSYIHLAHIKTSSFLFLNGLLLMFAGTFCSMINNTFGFWNFLIYIQPLTIIAFIVIIFINNKYNQNQILKRTRELLELEKQSSKIQAAMLSSQIQPHFLYNTLTTIQELCYSEPDEAADLIVRFSQYLRNNIDFMNYDDLIPFETELSHIRNFIYIQNARHKNAITYNEDIELTDFSIPPLSVQPIIENAVKHGIMKEFTKGSVNLHVFKFGDMIHIVIRNNGRKFTREDLRPGHSISNIQTRLKYLVNGRININFDDEDPETVVEILVPAVSQLSVR